MMSAHKLISRKPGAGLWVYRRRIGGLLLVFLLTGLARAEDWPTYGHDMARSQTTTEQLSLPLQECWVYQPIHAPRPAWGDPKAEPVEHILELRRVHFDDVFQVAVAGSCVYFGSSADGKVHCLDLATGKIRWTFLTGGPIRLAPTVAHGRVFAGSDDGHVYCWRADDGSLVWKFRAAPEDRRVLGHGKMISLWPVRTGVLVDGDVAYFGAGVFPAEGVFLYAVDAGTGRLLWRNDSCGETPQSGISPQGYLLASPRTLFAPLGRTSPASFDRLTGKLLEQVNFGKTVGGTFALLADNRVFTGTEEIISFDGHGSRKGGRFVFFEGRKIVVRGNSAYLATERQLAAVDLQRYPPLSSKLKSLMSGKESAGQMRSALLTQTRTVNQELVRLREDLQNAKASLATAAPTEQGAIRAKIDTIKEDIAGREQKLKAIQQSIQDYQNKLVQLDSDVKIARENLKIGQRWQTASRCDQALIRAGHTLFAGGPGEVIGVEAETGTIVWRTKVEGIAKGLAVANGRLLVSTDKGRIYAFGPAGTPQYGTVAESPVPSVNSEPSQTPISAQAEALLRESGVRRGYCLVHGCETGQLAVELARRSELMIYAVSPDAQKVAAARKTIDAAGLYGARICVEQWPVEQVPYGSYFANLVVSEQGSPSGKLSAQGLAEAWRLLKPQGGVALLPRAAIEGDTVPPFFREVAASIRAVGPWTKIVRGPLPGAGNWTHQYANPANTTCSDDQRLTCPLTVLWFGLPGPANMPSRHERAAAPLSLDGRVFCQGENIVMAFDAYNGLPLWERPLPGARRVVVSEYISNLAVCRDGLLVAVDNRCLRLDLATGKTLASYDLPPGPGDSRWGYLACDGTRIYGTRQEKPMPGKLSRRPSPTHHAAMVFALDLKSGQLLWTHAGSWIPHRSISLGDGRLYLVQDGVAPIQRETALEQRRQQIAQLPKAEQAAAQRALAKTEVRLVLALDPATGKVLWQQPLDVSFASGGSLATMSPEGRLVLFGVFLDGHYWKQFFAGDFSHRGVTVLAGNSGTLLWSRELGFRVRPLVIGDTLHAEPWAFDLHTGAQRTRVNPITGQTEPWQFARPGHHCGCPAASPHALFFRSWCLGYYDLVGDFGTQHFGAQRPGCWINFLPASGLLIMPEASTGCMCAFPNMTTVVFAPTRQEKNWSYYSASGPTVPVRRLALNMGAPGDRKDTAGNLWLGFPRPAGSLVLPLRMSTVMCPGGGYVSRNSTYTPIAGTSDPWLFTSAARGLTRCIVPLAGRADGTALYRVRLALADPDNDQPGQRVFQIKLQGKVICPACDIVKEAGGRDRALVKEFTGIEVKDALVLELVPRSPKPTPQQMPILQGLEIVRQRVISLGCTADPVVLNIKRLKHTTDLTLGNAREESFEGFLEIENLPNLKVAPARQALKLASGAHARLPIEIVATRTLPEGVHELAVKLVRGDGQVDTRSTITVEQLGRRERVVIPACEDAHVSKRFAQMNKGKADVLLVDGGDRDIGDLDHSLAFLKFRLPSGGKVVRAVLRLHNAGNATGDAGRLCLVEGTWNEERVTYVNRPALGPVVGRLGPMSNDQVVECPLDVDLTGKSELSLAIDPTSTDGVDFFARESSKPPELIIEYELPG